MMTRIMIILCLCFLIGGCSGNSGNGKKATDRTQTPDSANSNSNSISILTSSDEGAALIVKNDCRNCHREREKLIGPAFSDVAKRYGHYDIDSLAAKIIRGGAGHWGDVSMSAHPSLSMDDARVIIRFILKYK